jgi:hypothetical protein
LWICSALRREAGFLEMNNPHVAIVGATGAIGGFLRRQLGDVGAGEAAAAGAEPFEGD